VTDLFVIVEGQTEEQFVKRTLRPHLEGAGVYAQPRILPTKRDPRTGQIVSRGGGYFATWKKQLLIHLRSDSRPRLRFTTLLDLYGLPSDFPDYDRLVQIEDTVKRAEAAEAVLASEFDDLRLIPYFQRHEFEALLFADLSKLRVILEKNEQLGLDKLIAQVGLWSPEEINDGPTSAPSKRLKGAIRSYNKVVHGPQTVEAIGLVQLRNRCPRLNAWVTKLETLGRSG
jgi:hypothetical protein